MDGDLTVPFTLEEALDPRWLTRALAPLTGGAAITDVSVVETLRTVATKTRFQVAWADGCADLCLKGFLDMAGGRVGGKQALSEHRFYRQVAPALGLRIPSAVAIVIDEEAGQGITIMRDLVAQGARFGSALDPVTPDEAAKTLEELARLHAHMHMLDALPWVGRTVSELASWNIVTPERLQLLLEGPRGRNLSARTREAAKLIDGLNSLAALTEALPSTLVHGDCHAGNIFWTADGPGLIDWQVVQRGHWALDVAYQLCAVLPVDLAAAHEMHLLDHYLGAARVRGNDVPDRDAAHRQYRAGIIYGYYLWAITTRVDPAITETFVDRLGQAVERNGSYSAVGI